MNDSKLIPSFRFVEFKEGYTKNKLKELASFLKGKGYSKNDIVNYGFPIILYGRMYTNYRLNIKFINDTFVKNDKNSVKSVEGDVIIPASGETAEDISVASNIKRSGIIIGGDLNIIRPDNKLIDSSFLALVLSNGKVKQKIAKRAQGKSIVHIHNTDLMSLEIYFPSLNEQQKIGDFFSKLDKLLDLQQQKIGKLELLKKVLLQKLFPRHDAKIPELRFQGFNDEWKKEKLSKFGHTFSGLSGKTKKDFGHGKAKYITYMNVFKNPLTSKIELDDIEVDSKQHTVKYGDVLFTMSSETPEEVGMSSVWKYHLENIYLNSFSFGYRHSTNFDLNFLAFMFRSQVVREQIKILAQGISRYNISKNKMMEISAYFPTESEQQKIGNLLSKVDQLIELENKKLQNFQQVKKCLLQNMFVE